MTIGSVRSPHESALLTRVEESDTDAGSEEASAIGTGPRAERRKRIVLTCATCGGRNYRKTKARREGAAPLELMKFCSTCNAHTPHREAV